MTADIITISRMLFSVLMFVFSPYSPYFSALYLLCGISDVLDGWTARKLHTESEQGAMLDSIADLMFAAVYAVRILPFLSVPFELLIWALLIAAAKIAVIIIAGRKAHRLKIEHSFGNKLTGLMLFLLPLSVSIADVRYGAAIVCMAATVTLIREMTQVLRNKE